MTCAEFQKTFFLYESGELSPDEISAFEMHLKQCRRCRHDFDFNQSITEIYLKLPPQKISEKIKEQIQQRIKTERVLKSSFAANYKTWLTAAACLLLISTAIFRFYFYDSQPVPDIFDESFGSLNTDSIIEQVKAESNFNLDLIIDFSENDIQKLSDKLMELKQPKPDFSFSPGFDQKMKSIQEKINHLKKEPII